MVTSLLVVIPFGGTEARATTPVATGGPLRAAEYFGDGSPFNLWNTDLSGASSAFQQMKKDGFNAVGLVVPWGEFQEGVTPPRYNAAAFARLQHLVALASSLHMQVILRLSYQIDVDPMDQLSYTRFESLFAGGQVYSAWLGYISRVHRSVARFHNVKIAYLAWEDFWLPVGLAQGASTTADRLHLASATGYRTWLHRTYSLAKVSQLYDSQFSRWSDVPTPSYAQPAFELMYRFDDWFLIHRLYIPAAARFPGLNLEARVDIDPLYNGKQVVGSYSHADTFRLPNTSFIGMYYSPYMGDPSSSTVETTADALVGLKSTLSSMRTRAGGRPLFIFEFEIVSNSPAVASDPALPASQVPQFVQLSAPLLRQYTSGYALWTYHDFTLSPIYNPSFALGGRGWSLAGGAQATADANGSGSATLPGGSSVSQAFPPGELERGDVCSQPGGQPERPVGLTVTCHSEDCGRRVAGTGGHRQRKLADVPGRDPPVDRHDRRPYPDAVHQRCLPGHHHRRAGLHVHPARRRVQRRRHPRGGPSGPAIAEPAAGIGQPTVEALTVRPAAAELVRLPDVRIGAGRHVAF